MRGDRAHLPGIGGRRESIKLHADRSCLFVNMLKQFVAVGGFDSIPAYLAAGDYDFVSAACTSFMASSLAHSAGPASVPISQPCGSTSSVVGMPNALPTSFKS